MNKTEGTNNKRNIRKTWSSPTLTNLRFNNTLGGHVAGDFEGTYEGTMSV